MQRGSLDASLAGAGPQRLSAPHPRLALAAADFGSVVLAGLFCRGLNPAGHAGHTPRALLVVLATGGLAALLRYRRRLQAGIGAFPGRSRDIAALLCLAHAFALMLLALLLWEQAAALWEGAEDGILATNLNWLFAWAIAASVLLLLARRPVEAALTRAPPAQPRRA